MKVIMKTLLFSVALALTMAEQANPLEKVLEMISDMQNKLIKEGSQSQKMYSEFSKWCEDRSQELHFEVKTGKAQVASLTAAIEKGVADGEVLNAKISDGASSVADDESELKAATAIRKGDNKAFMDLETELSQTVDMLERAMSVVKKEMSGGAFLQSDAQTSAQNVLQAFQAMVEASSVSQSDAKRLTALVQSSSSSSEEDSAEEEALGAPSAAATENQSGGIVGTLQGLLEKAEEQLASARKEEQQAAHDYQMKKQSLDDSLGLSAKELTESKSSLAGTKEKKAVNEGDLTATTTDLQEDVVELKELHHTCLSKATDFEEETKSRADELGALAQAKKIITETTGGASGQTYELVDTSFLQVGSTATGGHALKVIRHLAYADHSSALMQLASRMQTVLRLGNADGADPFAKVKGMIMDMLDELQKAAEAEATEKAYCDKETAETKAKLDDKTEESEGLSTKIAQKEGASRKLKGEVVTLQNELAAMAKMQGEIDALRQKENAAYKKNKPEMEQGLNGVKMALKVLKEYYAKPAFMQVEAGTKGANEIIGLLEVAESDFSKLVAEMIAEEEQAQVAYDETTQENAVSKKTKDQDVKYKTREAAGLDKAATELKADLAGVSDELGAVKAYKKELDGRCIKKPPSYEEIKKRREAEIAGLKDALITLEGDAGASFLQEKSVSHRTLRGIRRA